MLRCVYLQFIFIFICNASLQLPSINSVGGLPANIVNNRADLAGVCLDHGCRSFEGMLGPPGNCAASFLCSSCALALDASQFCQNVKPPGLNALILAAGYHKSDATVKGSIFKSRRDTLRLGIKWAEAGQAIDVTKCAVDDLTMSNIAKIRAKTGPAVILHVRLVFMVSILKDAPNEWIKPGVDIIVLYHPPAEDMQKARYIGGGRCPKLEFLLHLGSNHIKKLQEGELANVVQSITVPWDNMATITDENFEVRLKCQGVRNCDLSGYRFCFRVMCQIMPQKQLVQLLLIQEQKLKPQQLQELPSIPPELLEELNKPLPAPYVPTSHISPVQEVETKNELTDGRALQWSKSEMDYQAVKKAPSRGGAGHHVSSICILVSFVAVQHILH